MPTPSQRALRLLEDMPSPINLCPLPDWLPPQLAQQLITDGKISVTDIIHGEKGEIAVLNGVVVTGVGHDTAHPKTDWRMLAVLIALAALAATVGIFLLARWLR